MYGPDATPPPSPETETFEHVTEVEFDDFDPPPAAALAVAAPPPRTALEAKAEVMADLAGQVPVGTQAVVQRASTFLDRLKAHQIVDDATFLACDDLFTAAARMLDEIAASYDPIISAANKAHKEAIAQKAKHYKPIADALADAKQRYLAEKQRRDAKAEEERRLVEQALRDEHDQAVRQEVEQLEAAGDVEGAADVIERAQHTHIGAIAPPSSVVNTLANVSTSGTWKVIETEIDLMALVKAVAAGQAPIQALLPSMTYLNSRARADKSALKIAGVTPRFVPNVRVKR